MNNPKFSIIIPVFNSEKFLKQCVESVRNQSYKNYELYLIDDGSESITAKLCDDLSVTDDRIVVIHKENQGICATRNQGIKLAKGEYLIFFDNDDFICSDYLSKLVKKINNSNADIYVNGFIKKQVNCNNNIVEECRICEKNQELNKREKSDYVVDKFGESFNPVWSKAYKRSWIINNNIMFDERYKKGMEDVDFNLKAFSISGKVVLTDIIGYQYFVRDGQSTSRKYNNKLLEDNMRLMMLLLNNYCKTINDSSKKLKINKTLADYLVVAILENYVMNLSYKEMKDQLKCIKNDVRLNEVLNKIKSEKLHGLNKYQRILFVSWEKGLYLSIVISIKLKYLLKRNSNIFIWFKNHL